MPMSVSTDGPRLHEMRSGDSYINVLREANQIAGTYSTDEALFSSPKLIRHI